MQFVGKAFTRNLRCMHTCTYYRMLMLLCINLHQFPELNSIAVCILIWGFLCNWENRDTKL